MFRSYMWTIFRLRFLTYRLVIQDVRGICFNSGYHDPELLEVNYLYFCLCTHSMLNVCYNW